jgi:hypothetical protein
MAKRGRMRLVFRDHVKELADGTRQVKVYEPATFTVRRLRFDPALEKEIEAASIDAIPRDVKLDFDEVLAIDGAKTRTGPT